MLLFQHKNSYFTLSIYCILYSHLVITDSHNFCQAHMNIIFTYEIKKLKYVYFNQIKLIIFVCMFSFKTWVQQRQFVKFLPKLFWQNPKFQTITIRKKSVGRKDKINMPSLIYGTEKEIFQIFSLIFQVSLHKYTNGILSFRDKKI